MKKEGKYVCILLSPGQGEMAASVMAGSAVKPAVEGKGKLMDNLSNYIIVDIGANLTNKKFSRDLDQVIQRATDSGAAAGA